MMGGHIQNGAGMMLNNRIGSANQQGETSLSFLNITKMHHQTLSRPAQHGTVRLMSIHS